MAAPAPRFGAKRSPTSANATANPTGNKQQITIVPPNGETRVLDSAPTEETAVPQALAAVEPRKKRMKTSDRKIYARDKDATAGLFGGIDLSRDPPTPDPETPKEPVWQSAKQKGKRRASVDLGAGEPRSGTLLKELAIHEPEVVPFPRAKAEVPKREFTDVSAVTPELHAKMRKVPYQPYFTTDPERKFPRSIIQGSDDDLEYAYRMRDVPKFTNFDPKRRLNSVVKIQLGEHEWLTVGSVMSYMQYIAEQNKLPELHARIESLLNPPEDMDTNDDGEDETPADGTTDDDMVDRPNEEFEEPAQESDTAAAELKDLVNWGEGLDSPDSSTNNEDPSDENQGPGSDSDGMPGRVNGEEILHGQSREAKKDARTKAEEEAKKLFEQQREAKEVERQLEQDQHAEELAAALKEKDTITDMINPNDVKSWVTLCSARPAVNLGIVMARDSEGRPSRTVTCKIYATGIRVEDNDVYFDMARGKTVVKDKDYIESIHPRPIDPSTFPASSEHHVADAYQDDRLLQLVVYPHVHVTNRELSELKSRPVFDGITKQELAMLFTKVRRDPNSLSPAAKLVAFLAHGDPKVKNNATADDRDDFAIDIFCESSPEAKITDFCAYARVLFYGAASLGNHWFSRIEAGQRLAIEEFPYDKITPPRWMVSKWRVWSKLDKHGKTVLTKQGKPMIEEVVPIEWHSYAEIDLHLYPDARTLAHELVGCEARESLKAKNEVDRLSGKDNTKFYATVIRHPEESNDKLQDCYLVFLTFMQGEQRIRIQPSIGTRCNFSLWHEGQVVTLASHVVENVKPKKIKVGGKNTGASYDDCITLWSKPTKPLVTPLKEDKMYEVLLTYISDSTSSNRAINSSLKVLNSSVDDPLGSWFKDLLFAMPAPGGENMTSAKYRSNRMSISLRIKEDGTFNLFQAEYEPKAASMNEDQKKYAELLLNEYASAFIKVFGVPGAGKSSWCAVPAIRALWAAGFKILVCAVSNMAVVHLMEELVKDIERNPAAWDGYDRIQLARYKSALAKATGDQPANAQGRDLSMSTPFGTAPGAWAAHEEEVDQKLLNLSYFERAAFDDDDDYLPEFAFGRQKLRFVQNSLQGKNADSARQYLALRTRLAATKNAKDRKEVRLQLNDAEGEWTNRYLSECVRILFVTTNSCGSAALTAFRPDIGFLDEAGQASAGDLAIVVHAFPTLKKLCGFGDVLQIGPVSFSGSCNEFQCVSKDAPFAREIDQGIGDIVFLRKQHRMHPDIADFVSNFVYNAKMFKDKPMITSEECSVETELDKIINFAYRDMFELLPKEVSGRVLFIDTEEMFSARPKGKTTQINTGEAISIASCIQQLTFNGFPASQIMVICMYAGQLTEVNDYLWKQAGDTTARAVRKLSSNSCLGQEAPVVFMALSSNIKGDAQARIKFISEQRRIVTAMTRARRYLFVFGNFTGWLRALTRGKPKTQSGQLFKKETELFSQWVRYGESAGLRVPVEKFVRSAVRDPDRPRVKDLIPSTVVTNAPNKVMGAKHPLAHGSAGKLAPGPSNQDKKQGKGKGKGKKKETTGGN